MKLKNLSLIALGCIGFTIAAQANEVTLTANQPVNIAFRIAHQNQGSQPIFSELHSVTVNKNVTIPIDLNHYDLAGMIIVAVDGHELPSSANHFDQPEQCSMTTDKTKSTGTLAFTLSTHKADCSTRGGIFG